MWFLYTTAYTTNTIFPTMNTTVISICIVIIKNNVMTWIKSWITVLFAYIYILTPNIRTLISIKEICHLSTCQSISCNSCCNCRRSKSTVSFIIAIIHSNTVVCAILLNYRVSINRATQYTECTSIQTIPNIGYTGFSHYTTIIITCIYYGITVAIF